MLKMFLDEQQEDTVTQRVQPSAVVTLMLPGLVPSHLNRDNQKNLTFGNLTKTENATKKC